MSSLAFCHLPSVESRKLQTHLQDSTSWGTWTPPVPTSKMEAWDSCSCFRHFCLLPAWEACDTQGTAAVAELWPGCQTETAWFLDCISEHRADIFVMSNDKFLSGPAPCSPDSLRCFVLHQPWSLGEQKGERKPGRRLDGTCGAVNKSVGR